MLPIPSTLYHPVVLLTPLKKGYTMIIAFIISNSCSKLIKRYLTKNARLKSDDSFL